MAVKNNPKTHLQTINQRLEQWLDHSAPKWFRYLARFEWHTRPETRREQFLNYGLAIIIVIALVIYTFTSTA